MNIEKNIVTESLESIKQKGYKRRYIYEGWNNYTKFEIDFIKKVKETLRNEHNIDITKYKSFGPRGDIFFTEKTHDVVNGADRHFCDGMLLKFCVIRKFNFDLII